MAKAKICIKTLADTVPLMTSDDYKERFRAEYAQMLLRYKKLSAMLEKHAAGKLEFTPTCPVDLLRQQAERMDMLLRVLEKRAEIEQVAIDDIEVMV